MAEFIAEVDGWIRRLTETRIVRCRNCDNATKCEDGTLDCHGPLVQTWDYYNDAPLRNPVPPDGFCFCGVLRGDSGNGHQV